MKVELTRITKDPVLAIEEAASNCYDSEPSVDGKIMAHCITSGHTSVTEFCDFTFHIEGISRALSHQLVRHRLASYAQRSQRYCSEDGFNYVTPSSIQNNQKALDAFKTFMETCDNTYKCLQSFGIPNEDARMVLPNACETQIEVKMNLRTLIHFMNERLCGCAQWEIRELAQRMRKAVIEAEPRFTLYLVPKCESGKIPYCPESPNRSCGRQPLAKDIISLMYKEN